MSPTFPHTKREEEGGTWGGRRRVNKKVYHNIGPFDGRKKEPLDATSMADTKRDFTRRTKRFGDREAVESPRGRGGSGGLGPQAPT